MKSNGETHEEETSEEKRFGERSKMGFWYSTVFCKTKENPTGFESPIRKDAPLMVHDVTRREAVEATKS